MAELNPYFVYNGVSSASYGVKCTKFAMPIAPTMTVVNEDIPGAYGNYFEGINYTSKSFTFKVYLDTNGSRERMQEITDQMAEYLILYDEDNPEAITDFQAQELAEVLRNAYSKGYNVVCHCYAGLCRSGAVVEAGVFIGFNPPDKVRLPNDLVLKKLYKALGAESTPKRYDFIFREDFVWN